MPSRSAVTTTRSTRALEPFDQALGEVVAVRARRVLRVQPSRDRVRLGQTDPDRQAPRAVEPPPGSPRGCRPSRRARRPRRARATAAGLAARRARATAARQSRASRSTEPAGHGRPRGEHTEPGRDGRRPKQAPRPRGLGLGRWSGRLDSNQRPLRPERSALPNCATPRQPDGRSMPDFRGRKRHSRRPAQRLECAARPREPRPRRRCASRSPPRRSRSPPRSRSVGAARPRWFVGTRAPCSRRSRCVTLLALPCRSCATTPLGLALADRSVHRAAAAARRPGAREPTRRAVHDFGDDEVYVIAMETDDVFRRERLERSAA